MSEVVTARRAFLVMACVVSAVVLRPVRAAGEEPPFAIHRRRMPAGEDLNVLLPPVLESFKRDALPAGATLKSDEDLNVTYRSGGDTVDMGISKPESAADAREAIKVSREEAVASKISLRGERFSLKGEPAYFHVGDFIAWSRGQYFFYAKASSAATLARFMAVYPF